LLNKSVIVMMFLIFSAPLLCLAAATPAAGPQAFLPESVHEFAPVVEGARVEHEFIIQNHGDAPLVILDLKSG